VASPASASSSWSSRAFERAKTFYDSPEYRAAREQRRGAAEFNLLIVEG